MHSGGKHRGWRDRVLMVNAQMDRYRIPFYDLLRADLESRGIELQVVYGVTAKQGAERADPVELDWGHRVDSRLFHIGGRTLSWQPCVDLARDADLIIVEQASKRLLNYLLLARQLAGRGRVALWGHGRNFQRTTMSPTGEAIKQRVSRLPHWWFAYNDLSAGVVQELGFPRDRITPVQNAIDSRWLVAANRNLDPERVTRFRHELSLRGRHVAIYCGGIYPEKRPHFAVEAALAIRDMVWDFELIIVGDGVDADVFREAARENPWIHFLGPRFDDDKVLCFALAQVFFLPGLVGLAILDSFALETPMVASCSAEHSPEIDYLENEVNGLLVDDQGSVDVYAKAVAGLLTDEDQRARLINGCRESQERYTIEEMASRFSEGIAAALKAPRRRPFPVRHHRG